MPLFPQILEPQFLPGEPVPLGALLIMILVKPVYISPIDSFPLLLANSLDLVSSKVNFSYTRYRDEYAWLRWDCSLIGLWRNDNIYKILRKHLYANFDYWELYIYLSIPSPVIGLPSPFI